MKNRTRAALVVALALVAGAALPAAADEHEPPPTDDTTTTTTEPPDTEPPAEDAPVPAPEPEPEPTGAPDDGTAGDGGALSPAATALVEQALGDRLGQIRVDGGSVRVAVLDATDADTRRLRRLTGLGEKIAAVPTAYADAQLQDYLDAAEAGLPKGKVWAMGPVYEFTDTEAIAAVHVTSDSFTDEEEAHIRSVVPSEVLQLREDAAFTVEPAHATRAEYPPYEGGLHVDFVLVAPCSTNFVHLNGFGSFGTSSGHCPPQATWNSHPIRMGAYSAPLRANYYWNQTGNETYSDTSMWLIPATDQTSRIMVNTNTHRTIVGRWNGATTVGQGICHQGIGTGGGGWCTSIVANNQRFTDANGIVHRFHDCMGHIAHAGDSGGAVYSRPAAGQAWAAGTVWGNIYHDGTLRACFSRVQYAVWFHGEILMG